MSNGTTTASPKAQSELVNFLRGEIYDQDRHLNCGANELAPLLSDKYCEISDHKLLLLAGLPDYLCRQSNAFVPIVVNTEGKMLWGKRMAGVPSMVVQGLDGKLWLVSQWSIEASYPMLYRSENGVDWIEIPTTMPELGSQFPDGKWRDSMLSTARRKAYMRTLLVSLIAAAVVIPVFIVVIFVPIGLAHKGCVPQSIPSVAWGLYMWVANSQYHVAIGV